MSNNSKKRPFQKLESTKSLSAPEEDAKKREKPATQSTLNCLPSNLRKRIFAFLDRPCLASMSCVSRTYRYVLQENVYSVVRRQHKNLQSLLQVATNHPLKTFALTGGIFGDELCLPDGTFVVLSIPEGSQTSRVRLHTVDLQTGSIVGDMNDCVLDFEVTASCLLHEGDGDRFFYHSGFFIFRVSQGNTTQLRVWKKGETSSWIVELENLPGCFFSALFAFAPSESSIYYVAHEVGEANLPGSKVFLLYKVDLSSGKNSIVRRFRVPYSPSSIPPYIYTEFFVTGNYAILFRKLPMSEMITGPEQVSSLGLGVFSFLLDAEGPTDHVATSLLSPAHSVPIAFDVCMLLHDKRDPASSVLFLRRNGTYQKLEVDLTLGNLPTKNLNLKLSSTNICRALTSHSVFFSCLSFNALAEYDLSSGKKLRDLYCHHQVLSIACDKVNDKLVVRGKFGAFSLFPLKAHQ